MEEIKRRQLYLERFAGDMETATGQVLFILKEYPDTRDQDGRLLITWLKLFKGVTSFPGLEALADDGQFKFETIRRSRQKIQAAGLYLPSQETVIQRRRLQDVWRTIHGARSS